MTDVVFVPDWSRGNPYQRLLRAGIEKSGLSVSFAAVPAGLFPINRLLKKYAECSIVHIHWIDDLIEHVYWNRTPIVVSAKLLLFWLDIAIARIRGRRIVWTVHNLISHESPAPDIELRARRLLASVASRLFFHGKSALDRVQALYRMNLGPKASIIEHGNYIGHYPAPRQPTAELRRSRGIADDDVVVLFFGAIRGYKGLERLIPAFGGVARRNIRLLVAGKCYSPAIAEKLAMETGKDDRVSLTLGFVPEPEVSELFAIADVVVAPFERTLTSGSVILAMSMGKALVLPNEARLLDVVSDEGADFFETDAELKQFLENADRTELKRKGEFNLLRMQSADWMAIGKRVVKAYTKPIASLSAPPLPTKCNRTAEARSASESNIHEEEGAF